MVSFLVNALVIVVCLSIFGIIAAVFVAAAKSPKVADGINPIIRTGSSDENYWRS
jgi:hypothetical protein